MLTLALLLAQAASPAACPTPDGVLPPQLSGWTQLGPTLEAGHATVIRAAEPAPAQASKRPGGVGTLPFTVRAAGTYRIALDQPGWLDVRAAGGGEALTSTVHGHGPACTTIRKLVGFTLLPGAYTLELTGLPKPVARVMLVAGD
jgi:hypothetical protein